LPLLPEFSEQMYRLIQRKENHFQQKELRRLITFTPGHGWGFLLQ
jgi:hypothetical protein